MIAFEKAGKAYSMIGDELSLSNVYAYMADVEKNRGHYEKSLQYSVKWLDITKKLNNKRYLDIWASLYENIGDYETAVDYFRQAAQYARETQHFDELAWFIQSIGEIFFLQAKYDSARYYYDMAIHYNPNNQLYSRRGELYIVFKKYDTALLYLNKSLNTAKKAGARNQEMWILLRLGKGYKEMGDNKERCKWPVSFYGKQRKQEQDSSSGMGIFYCTNFLFNQANKTAHSATCKSIRL
ncbi:MAG: tetratricopeptide repeat protein [Segetibacter sp.]